MNRVRSPLPLNADKPKMHEYILHHSRPFVAQNDTSALDVHSMICQAALPSFIRANGHLHIVEQSSSQRLIE